MFRREEPLPPRVVVEPVLDIIRVMRKEVVGDLIDADDVLFGVCVVVDVQHIISLGAELLILRRQPHLLAVRLQVSILQNPPDARLADAEVQLQRLQVHRQQARRPMGHRHAHIGRLATSLSDYLGCV